jgi:hypothetical protein
MNENFPGLDKLNNLEAKLEDIINTYRKRDRQGRNSIEVGETDRTTEQIDLKEWIKNYKTSIRNHSSSDLQFNSFNDVNQYNSIEESKHYHSPRVEKIFKSSNVHANSGTRISPPKYRRMQEYTAEIYYNCIPTIDKIKKNELENRIQKMRSDKLTRYKILEIKSKNHQKIKHFKVGLKRRDDDIFLPQIK